jgi:hypothetical protein
MLKSVICLEYRFNLLQRLSTINQHRIVHRNKYSWLRGKSPNHALQSCKTRKLNMKSVIALKPACYRLISQRPAVPVTLPMMNFYHLRRTIGGSSCSIFLPAYPNIVQVVGLREEGPPILSLAGWLGGRGQDMEYHCKRARGQAG